MKAVNIKWDTDGNLKLAEELPSKIEIPNGMAKDEIEDYLSEMTGFCHYGFQLGD